MLAVLVVGLLMNLVALPLAALRSRFLFRVISSGQPAPDRIEGVTHRTGAALRRQLVEVFAQRKMLKWSVPGAAHFFVMWAFFILATVYLEAYGSLIKLLIHGGSLPDDVALSWAIPFVGHWAVLGFAQDFIAVMCLVGLATFVVIRVKNAPKELGRKSRFFGSHLGPAWFTLFMIFNVIWTLFLFRGASAGLHTFMYKNGAFGSIGVGALLDGLPRGALEAIEGIGLLLHIGVMLAFLIFVLNSKHLHIFLAPLNIMFGRAPVALGAAKPMMSDGKALTLEDFEDLDEDAKLGVGASEDFSWKGILDFSTCTECGRCQDQCPAWNTEKPLSPKLMIMALRDSQMAKAPYLLAPEAKREALLEGSDTLTKEVERPLVGDTGDEWFYMPEDGSGVIDPDVLWSCVTCGACVNQCPVDIEHVDHIVDMRRYQVLVESNFPAELNGLFKGMESKGNPWNMSRSARLDWAKDLPFDVKVVGEDIESLDEVDWLFWVGCAGAYEDRAKKTTQAVAELLDMAGVSFGVLGNGETCTGDSARRAGNEFLFQGLAAENIETFKEYKVKKVVSTCAHCFNTLKNEYKDLGVELEVVHHTQLLNRLVREKKLTPVAATGGTRSVTYHDPCYIGRHNQVYAPPRELLSVIPDADFVEMPRNSERSFCCGAGGARMWMEEKIGSRINETRTAEAVGTGADQIAVGCPFCRVMLSDGLTSAQSKGEAREEVEVLDVAQMLLASIKGEAPKKVAAKAGANGAAPAGSNGVSAGAAASSAAAEDTKAEPEPGDATQTEDTVTKTEDVGPAAKASGGSSLFDVGDSDSDDSDSSEVEDAADEGADVKPESAADEKPAAAKSGGSLFDLGDETADDSDSDSDSEPSAGRAASAASDVETKEDAAETEDSTTPSTSSTPATEIPDGGSLFDIEDDSAEPAANDVETQAAEAAPEADGHDREEVEDAAADSTTDGDTDRAEDAADDSVEHDDSKSGAKPAASGTVSTPATEIPEGGSLFDIEPTEEESPAGRAASAASDVETKEPEAAPEAAEEPDEVEDAAADSTTGGDTDDSAGRAPSAASDVETPAAKAEAEEPDAVPEAKPARARPSGTLFDIAAPRGATSKAAAVEADDSAGTTGPETTPTKEEPAPAAAEAEAEPDEADVPTRTDDAPIRSLKDIKAGATATETDDSPSPKPESDAERDDEAEVATDDTAEADAAAVDAAEPEPEPEPESAADAEPTEKPKAASSGEAHAPKTDVEIAEGGSLFDL